MSIGFTVFASAIPAEAVDGTTDVTVQVGADDDGNIAWSAPTVIPMKATAAGTLIGPGADAIAIRNLSAFPIRVKTMDAKTADPFHLVADVDKSSGDNDFQMSVNGVVAVPAVELADMFYSCFSLTNLDFLSGWDTSSVTCMSSMFRDCISLTNGGGTYGWDTSNVTDMTGLFSGCSSLTELDLSNWDVSKIESMGDYTSDNGIFGHCSSLTILYLSGWDTSNVTSMTDLFSGCSSLTELDLSGWDTSKVTNMNGMFYDCSKLITVGDISSWDVSNVTDMSSMFQGCKNLVVDCSNWKVSYGIDVYFINKDAPNVILPNW